MKELNPLHQDNTRDEQQINAQRKQGQRHIPTGLKVWQIDPKTEIPVEVKAQAATQADKFGIKQTHLKVVNNPELFYCMAINPKNALRKYHKSHFYANYRRTHQTPGNPPQSGSQ